MPERLKTVLIFAVECTPYHLRHHTMGAQRPAHFARYLPENGWRAIVLCRDAQRPELLPTPENLALIAAETEQRITAAAPGESVIVPLPALQWDGQLDRLWRVAFKARGATRQMLLPLRKALTVAKLVYGDESQNWQPAARQAARCIMQMTQVDACVGEFGPDAGIYLARWLGQHYQVPWIIDFRDPKLEPFKPWFRRLLGPAARWFMAPAEGTIAVNEHLAMRDQEVFRRPAWTITNGFDPQDFTGLPPAQQESRFCILYGGTIYRNLQRAEIFFAGLQQALAQLTPEEAGQVVLRYSGVAHAYIRELAERFGVSQAVEISEWVERPALLAQMRQADLLLLFSVAYAKNDYYHATGCYHGKTFEYLGAGRPILLVPGDEGILQDLITRTQSGFVAPTPERVAEVLVTEFRSWRAGRSAPFAPQTELVAQYSRPALTRQLAAVLDQISRGASRESFAS